MDKLLNALLFCCLAALCGCTAPQPRNSRDYGVCSSDPGGYACQIERYQNVD